MNVDLNLEHFVSTYLVPWSINLLIAAAIFLVGRIVIRAMVSLLGRALKRADLDDTLIGFISSVVKTVLYLLVIVAVLDKLGVETTSLVALVGAAGLAVGLALKDSLQNFASGVMLILFRPFRAGHFIEAGGVSGSVEKIGIFNTILKTGDNREVIVPNGSIFQGTITNFSAQETRRIDLTVGIAYEDDLLKAKKILRELVEKDERIHVDPEPLIAVAELADSSVNLVLRPWVNSGDYWAVRFDLIENIKLAFDASGISIPYPQMTVHNAVAA